MRFASSDSHNYIKHLVKTGITESQAEVIIKVVRDINKNNLDNLATQTQLENFYQQLKFDLEKLEM
jgi:hypothetical protein